jgi:hypothetical protein
LTRGASGLKLDLSQGSDLFNASQSLIWVKSGAVFDLAAGQAGEREPPLNPDQAYRALHSSARSAEAAAPFRRFPFRDYFLTFDQAFRAHLLPAPVPWKRPFSPLSFSPPATVAPAEQPPSGCFRQDRDPAFDK